MKTLFAGSYGVIGGVILVVLLGASFGLVSWRNARGGKVLSEPLAEPLDGATAALVEINAGSGNLTIDRLSSGEPLLAGGSLQYLESQGLPTRTRNESNGQARFTLKMGEGGKSWLRLPWDACNGGFDWLIHLNPTAVAGLTAHSGGGNLKLDLAGVAVTRLSADTGGGNVDLVLPEDAAALDVTAKTGAGNVTVAIGSGLTGSNNLNAKSGAGNVTVSLPGGLAARIHASSGAGKAIVDPRFSKIDKDTYQSPDYNEAANRIEITVNSGAGNVIVNTK